MSVNKYDAEHDQLMPIAGNAASVGHTIEDSSGTELEQRDILKVGGSLIAEDDSTNEKTIITDGMEEIDYEDWIALTPQEQAAIPKALITNAPEGAGAFSNVRYNSTDHTIEVYDNGAWETVFVNIYPGTYKGTLIFMLSMNTSNYSCKVLSVSLSIDASSNYVYVALDNEETLNNINSNTSTQIQDHGLLGFGGYYGAGYGVHVLGAAGIKTKTFTAHNIGLSTNTAIINAMLPIASTDLTTPANPSDMSTIGGSNFTNSPFMFILAS